MLYDKMFKAFADETRLRILHLLVRGEFCVCDIMSTLDLSQPKVSRHLAYLKRAGLVNDRKQGRWRHYSLAPSRSTFHKRLVTCIGDCLDEAPRLKRDGRRLASLKRIGCG